MIVNSMKVNPPANKLQWDGLTIQWDECMQNEDWRNAKSNISNYITTINTNAMIILLFDLTMLANVNIKIVTDGKWQFTCIDDAFFYNGYNFCMHLAYR